MRSLSWIVRLGLVIAAGALLITGVVVGAAPRMWEALNAHEEEPADLPKFEPVPERTSVYDINGDRIAVFNAENSQPIELDDVPKRVIDSFLAVEDQNFYDHNGINIRGVWRAALANFESETTRQGASTITMQVVTNEFLNETDRDGRYKALQIHYSLMLERQMTKDQILERYFNIAYFGNRAYGVQAAAETYFGKPVDELTIAEAGFLAGLVRSPSGYDPIEVPAASKERFGQVLDRLVDAELIGKRQAERLSENFEIPWRVHRRPDSEWERTYYTEALRDYLLNRSDILGETYEERYNELHRGGLQIHTTFDPGLQAKAEAAHAILPENDQGIEAAMVSLDSKSGAIRAMVGGSGFIPGQNEVNMALAPNQTGSSSKIFILAAALQAGAHADDLIDGNDPCVVPNPQDPAQPYEIDAVDGGGVVTLLENTYESVNCAYALLAQAVGLNRVVDMTYRMAESPYMYQGQGLPDGYRREPVHPVASFPGGSNELSALDLASGAQTIANEGVHHEPYYVERIDSSDGKTMYQHKDAGTRVLDRRVALEAVDILSNVSQSGATGWRYPLENDRPMAGKTGTYQDATDSTFVGFTRQLSTAVWLGHPDNSTTPMKDISEFAALGDSSNEEVQGGRAPMHLWKAFMDQAHAGWPIEDWPEPPEVKREPMRIYLPGYECVRELVGYEPRVIYGFANPAVGSESQAHGIGSPVVGAPPPAQPTPTDPGPDPEPDPEPEPENPTTTRGNGGGNGNGNRTTTTAEQGPGGGGSRSTTTSAPRPTAPPPPTTRIEQIPVYDNVDATTIAPDVSNPNAPLPMVDVSANVSRC